MHHYVNSLCRPAIHDRFSLNGEGQSTRAKDLGSGKGDN